MKRIKTEILKVKPGVWRRRGRNDIKILDFIYNEDFEIFKVDVYTSRGSNGKKIKLDRVNHLTSIWLEEALIKYDELRLAYLEFYDYLPDGSELELEGFDESFDVLEDAQEKTKNITGELPRKLSV
jgi:hypothetical protein